MVLSSSIVWTATDVTAGEHSQDSREGMIEVGEKSLLTTEEELGSYSEK